MAPAIDALDPWYLEHLVCPADRTRLEFDGTHLVSAAGRRYPVVDGMPVMLMGDRQQTMDIARISFERASGNASVIDHRAPDYYLETLGVGEPQRARLVELVRDGIDAIDPVVSLLIAGTSGTAYLHLVGNTELAAYPIPSIDVPASKGGYLLDVGCNWGRWCVAATRAGHKAVGIDPSLGAVMAARRVARQLGLDIKYVVGDARWLPFAERSFDVIHSYSVIQHFSKADARRALREMGRVLNPEGTAKIQMANRIGIRSFQTQWRRGFKPPEKFDVRYWPLSGLKRSFEQAIGPTRIVTDCYFGLGWQWADFGVMQTRHKPVLIASEILKRLSRIIPPMTRVADSVYCIASKPGG